VQLVEQVRGGRADRLDGAVEGGGVVGGGSLETGDLADVLQRGGPHVLFGDLFGVRRPEGSDVSAHAAIVRRPRPGRHRSESPNLRVGPDHGISCPRFSGRLAASEPTTGKGGSCAGGS